MERRDLQTRFWLLAIPLLARLSDARKTAQIAYLEFRRCATGWDFFPMGIRRHLGLVLLIAFEAFSAFFWSSIPLKAGRTANGTSDYMQVSLTTKGIFASNISAGSQAQGTVSFFLNLISFPGGSTTFPCGIHCGEIVDVIASHQASVNQCQTVSGACVDIFVCGSGNAFCGFNSIFVDITTPNVGELKPLGL